MDGVWGMTELHGEGFTGVWAPAYAGMTGEMECGVAGLLGGGLTGAWAPACAGVTGKRERVGNGSEGRVLRGSGSLPTQGRRGGG